MSDNRTTEQTATDRLRAMLDERGVDWTQGMAWNVTVINGDWLIVEDIDFGTLSVSTTAYQLTPEQAIAATLKAESKLLERENSKLEHKLSNMETKLFKAQERIGELSQAATLGNERELIDLAHNAWSMALCAMQGMPIPAEWGDAVERGLRKHGIDVDEELAAFEVIDDER